jgi:hypothetical protein
MSVPNLVQIFLVTSPHKKVTQDTYNMILSLMNIITVT